MQKIFLFASAFAIIMFFSFGERLPNHPKKIAPKKPNIVIFLADDLGYHDTEPYGNKVVKTPHLNQLASQSIRFTNAFANTPTCVPSRSSFYTGLMPVRNGSHANNVKGYAVGECRLDVKSLPHYLKAAGYRVALAGKKHIGPLSVFPFEFIANSEVREKGYENKPGLFTDLNTVVVDEWLGNLDANEPFCLVVCDNSPHVIWPETSIYKNEDLDVPPNAIATEEYKSMRSRYYTDVTKMDNNLGHVMSSLKKHGYDDNTVFIFTSDQGPQFPFAKWNLYDEGVRVPLLIKWPGKIKTGTSEAMVSHVDILPTLLQISGAKNPGSLDGKNYADVLLKNKKEHRKEVFLTHSQDGLMNITPMRGLRTDRYKYILNLSPEYEYHTHIDAARDHDGGASYWISWEEKAKEDTTTKNLIQRYYFRPKEELYDVVNDPYEQNNLVHQPKLAPVLAELRKRLVEFRRAQNDTITGPILDIESTWKSEQAVEK